MVDFSVLDVTARFCHLDPAHENPAQWLRLDQSDLPLFTAPPEITRQGSDIEIRFNVPENTARLLLQRIAKTDAPPPATASN